MGERGAGGESPEMMPARPAGCKQIPAGPPRQKTPDSVSGSGPALRLNPYRPCRAGRCPSKGRGFGAGRTGNPAGPLPRPPARTAAMTDPPATLAEPPAYWLAECPACGRTRAADRGDMLGFLRGPWPACCGDAMTFRVADGDPPLAEPAD
jgi:hypothetical protein